MAKERQDNGYNTQRDKHLDSTSHPQRPPGEIHMLIRWRCIWITSKQWNLTALSYQLANACAKINSGIVEDDDGIIKTMRSGLQGPCLDIKDALARQFKRLQYDTSLQPKGSAWPRKTFSVLRLTSGMMIVTQSCSHERLMLLIDARIDILRLARRVHCA